MHIFSGYVVLFSLEAMNVSKPHNKPKTLGQCLTIWLGALLAYPAIIVRRHCPRQWPLYPCLLVPWFLRILLRPIQGTLVVGQVGRAIDAIRHRTASGIRSSRLARSRETFRRRGRRRGGRRLLGLDSVDPSRDQRRGRPLHLGRRVRGGFGDRRCHTVRRGADRCNAMRLNGTSDWSMRLYRDANSERINGRRRRSQRRE